MRSAPQAGGGIRERTGSGGSSDSGKKKFKSRMSSDSYSFNQYLNASITEEEVKRASGLEVE